MNCANDLREGNLVKSALEYVAKYNRWDFLLFQFGMSLEGITNSEVCCCCPCCCCCESDGDGNSGTTDSNSSMDGVASWDCVWEKYASTVEWWGCCCESDGDSNSGGVGTTDSNFCGLLVVGIEILSLGLSFRNLNLNCGGGWGVWVIALPNRWRGKVLFIVGLFLVDKFGARLGEVDSSNASSSDTLSRFPLSIAFDDFLLHHCSLWSEIEEKDEIVILGGFSFVMKW